MHLYLIARGHRDFLNRWESDVMAHYYEYEYAKDKKGMLQLGLRPIQLYEMVFPEPQLNNVIAQTNLNYGEFGAFTKYKFFLQKALKLKEVPKIDPLMNYPLANHPNVHLMPIGLKKDRYEEGIEII